MVCGLITMTMLYICQIIKILLYMNPELAMDANDPYFIFAITTQIKIGHSLFFSKFQVF